MTRGAAGDTLIASYNDTSSVERLFDANRGEIAAVIVEPVAGNMGLVPPAADFSTRCGSCAPPTAPR